MRFFISFLSVVSLTSVVSAGSVYQGDLRSNNRLYEGSLFSDGSQKGLYQSQYKAVGNNPLEYLSDANQLEDETALNLLAEKSKQLINSSPNTIQGEMGPKKMLRMGVMCPRSVLLFSGREDVKFVLYNKNWQRGADISKDLGEGKLIPNAPIKFLIHGFLNSGNSMMIQVVKNAYMDLESDYNVIAVDWTKGSGTWLSNYFGCLITSRIVPKVGEAVATFIVDLINKQDVNILNVNVIGHSLGAQISGRAGKKLIELGYKLPIIVGLDPALPEFQYSPESERLASTDAEYVEVIHTNPGDLGFEIPLGVADFYPNWGQNRYNRQPNCVSPACSHAMSFVLFAESIINPIGFEAYKCESFETMKAGQCKNFGDRITVYMGGADMRVGKYAGVFKLETNHFAPYGRS